MNMRVAAFVDHEVGFRLLGKMLAAPLSQQLQLSAVVTTVENGKTWWPGVEALCREHGLPLLRYDESFDVARVPGPVDAVLLLSWKHLLPDSVLEWPRLGTVNLHYSLLPELRGVYPVNWALIEGRDRTGVTFHLVNSRIDAGPALLQREIPIAASDTSRSLQLRLDDLAVELFDELVPLLPHLPGKCEDGCERAGSYRSRRDFDRAREIHPERMYRGSELIDLLRGMSFLPESRNAYFVDPASGERIYVNLSLHKG